VRKQITMTMIEIKENEDRRFFWFGDEAERGRALDQWVDQKQKDRMDLKSKLQLLKAKHRYLGDQIIKLTLPPTPPMRTDGPVHAMMTPGRAGDWIDPVEMVGAVAAGAIFKPAFGPVPKITRADFHITLRSQGYEFHHTTRGGYVLYRHTNGSQIWIKPNGQVIRLGPPIPGSAYRPRIDASGNPIITHDPNEFVAGLPGS
jgi:hypothetical protein